MTETLFSILRQRFPADLTRTFLESGDGRVFTYADLVELSGKVANALAARGVQPGDRVAVHVEKSPENLFLYLGTVRAGAVYLPLNTAYTPAEMEYFLGDAEPRVVVCRPAEREAIEPLAGKIGAEVLTLGQDGEGSMAEAIAASPAEFAEPERSREDLAAILYTSGTTGRSKGAMLSAGNLASNAEVLAGYWRFTAEDRLLHALPIYHTHGLFTATNTIISAGASMLFLPRFDPDSVFAMLPRATAMMGVPTFYTRMLADPRLTREACARMRLFVSGSAPLLAETHRQFEERTGHAILERYGMTETNMNTSNPHDGERRPGTVGFPLPGVELRVADPETGKHLAQGEIGVLEVKGPNVFKGYWRNPEKTMAEFRVDGFFITGDLGMVDERGYVHIVGRGKDLIISGGFNVYPKEVESEIDGLPGVVESAVIGVPHPDFGEGVVAVVVPEPGAKPAEADITGPLAGRLAKFKQPKKVFFVDALPRNTMGKVQKNVLRESYKTTFTG
ncbi:malonyl-CoA synthase [Geminicoccaceae bacterium 1502E]|nr:malonyl-CoA synthase [Geminicoccaceae bacterium 1502E]